MKILRACVMATGILLLSSGISSAQKNKPAVRKVKQFYHCFSISETPVVNPLQLEALLDYPPCFEQNLVTNPRRYLLLFFLPEILQKELTECYFTQANLIEVMQMYNHENSVPMRRISDNLLTGTDTPLIPRYLKYPFFKPTPFCHYESTGDITRNNLQIFCTFHGAVDLKMTKGK